MLTSGLQKLYEALQALNCRPRIYRDTLSARCPAHDDDKPSLTAGLGDDGRVLLKCMAGCRTEDVLKALGLGMEDLFPRTANSKPEPLKEVAAYVYTDEAGKPLFEVVRFEPKTFRQRLPGGSWKLGDTRRVLYNLPGVLATVAAGGTIYIVEGEKDADAINALEGVMNTKATTCPGGANKWRPEYAQGLQGANVVIVADRDEPGAIHARAVAAALAGVAVSIQIVQARAGKDAYDHIKAGYGLADFQPFTPADELQVVSLHQIITTESEPIPWVYQGWLARGDMVIFAGESGLGKSMISLEMMVSLAIGKQALGFLQQLSGPLRVLYLDEENNPRLIRHRLRKIAIGIDIGTAQLSPAVIGANYSLENGINVDDPRTFDKLARYVEKWRPQVIFWDSLVRVHRRDENSNMDMAAVLGGIIKPLSRSVEAASIVIHHLGKPGRDASESDTHYRIRGASDIIASADQVWMLSKHDGSLLLQHHKSRWGPESNRLKIEMSDLADGMGIRVTASEPELEAKSLMELALSQSGYAGMERQALIALLESEGYDAASRTANKCLAKLYAGGIVKKKKSGKTVQYWLVRYAPESAE